MKVFLLIIGIFVLPIGFSQVFPASRPSYYCVPVSKIDFNPFREITDGKDLAYLDLILRSYISTDEFPGILSAYEFSPRGDVFTGKVSEDAQWPDGRRITPWEAAVGIAKGFTFRPIAKKLKVVGTEAINKRGWEGITYDGIKITDDKTFQLTFESEIKNITGVIREALSTESTHNRVWPARFSSQPNQAPAWVISKYLQKTDRIVPTFDVFGVSVEIVSDHDKCKFADYTLYPETLTRYPSDAYEIVEGEADYAATFQPNIKRMSFRTRTLVAAWFRRAYDLGAGTLNTRSVDRFFMEGEPGFQPLVSNGKSKPLLPESDLKTLRSLRLRLAIEINTIRVFFVSLAAKDQLDWTFEKFPVTNGDLDGQLLASAINKGRHIIFQDLLDWPYVQEFLENSTLSKNVLENVRQKSASTIPPNEPVLQQLEEVLLKEQTLVPIGRRRIFSVNAKGSPLILGFTSKNELKFSRRSGQ